MTRWSLVVDGEVDEAEAEGAGTVTVAVTVTNPEGAAEDEVGGVEAAPPVAADWKAENLSPGLTANTIPCWQWLPCLQYTHVGSVF